MARWICLIAVALAGCASIEPSPFRGPDGGQAYSMECSGLGRTIDACYRKAGEVCPRGYTMLSNDTQYAAWGGRLMSRRGIAVECK